jgi:hypothetical protein
MVTKNIAGTSKMNFTVCSSRTLPTIERSVVKPVG